VESGGPFHIFDSLHRAAAAAASDAALETAELHLKTVQRLRTAIAALDSALMVALASNTVND
jgi:hypothetical protein